MELSVLYEVEKFDMRFVRFVPTLHNSTCDVYNLRRVDVTNAILRRVTPRIERYVWNKFGTPVGREICSNLSLLIEYQVTEECLDNTDENY